MSVRNPSMQCAPGFNMRTIAANKMEPLENKMATTLLNNDKSLSICVAQCDDKTIPVMSLSPNENGLYPNPLNKFDPSFGYKCLSPPTMNYDSTKLMDVITQGAGMPSSATCNKGLLYSFNKDADAICMYNASAYPLKTPN